MKKILITGARGMLGLCLAQVFKDCSVTAWSKDILDITRHELVKREVSSLKPDIIINSAAYNDVDKAEEQIELAEEINGYAVGCLARSARETGAVFIHYSTDYVFAGDKEQGYMEDDEPNPQSSYGRSKRLGEKLLLAEAAIGLRYYIIRTSRLFGPPAASPGAKKSFVQKISELAIPGTTVQGVDEEFTSPTYALDLANRTREILTWQKPSGIYHVTNGGGCTWYEFAREIFKLSKSQAQLIPVKSSNFPPRPATRPKFSLLLNAKLPPMRPWQEALEEFLALQN